MYKDDLPEFEKREMHFVLPYAKGIFGKSLVKLVPHDDGHFRAIFKPEYFTLVEGNTEPSKSQWSTLKKKFKRHNKGVFIYRETGKDACDEQNADSEGKCLFIDFGFFLY